MTDNREALIESATEALEFALRREVRARQRAAEALTGDNPFSEQDVERLLSVQAQAQPWHEVEKIAGTGGKDLVDAVITVRREITRNLIQRHERTSTSQLVIEMDRLRRQAEREFLTETVQYEN
ncbi:hypothetical protein [Streptomyces sp. TR02-1]|uniref:hypothetical protein n=1 Tax=Streptomyces sp. TR02-1 TaxID=3385977 RepID=UPI0039A3D060